MDQNENEIRCQGDTELGGDWCTITQKKTKRKNKGKRKILALGEERVGGVKTELIKTSGGVRALSPSSSNLPTLSPEEAVRATSIRTYFANLFKNWGPTRSDDSSLKDEIEHLEASNKLLIDRYPNFTVFLSKCKDIQLIDNYLCHEADTEKAKGLAIDAILKEFGVYAKSSPTSQYAQDTKSWNNQPDMGPDPFQSVLGAMSGSISTTAQADPATSRLRSASLQNDTLCHQSQIDSLNRRMEGLTKCNSDLLSQLQDKEKAIFSLKQTRTRLEEQIKTYKALQNDFLSVQHELIKLRMEPNGGPEKSGNLSNSQIIMQLQKQLEVEKLNSHNLKQQLDLERAFSAIMTSKPASRGSTVRTASSRFNETSRSPSSGGSSDSLGLRGILSAASSNATTPMPSGSAVGPLSSISRSSSIRMPPFMGASNLSLSQLPPPNSSKFDNPISTLLSRPAPKLSMPPPISTTSPPVKNLALPSANVFNAQKLL